MRPADLPALPSVMTEIMRLSNDSSAGIRDMEMVISSDQGLAVRVLKVANSSFYGATREVGSVRHAVALLGTDQIRNIASALAVAPLFRCQADGLLDGPHLWMHSLATALWTEVLSKAGGLPHGTDLFTAALLHDIGIVLLLQRAPEAMFEVLRAARDHDEPLCDAERAAFGTDHAALGSAACAAWNLPPTIARLIGVHETSLSVDHPSARLLRAGEHLATHTGQGAFVWKGAPGLTRDDWQGLGIPLSVAPSILEQRHRIEETTSALFRR